MAKSLRSKWRRKCRAVKRERYGAKELERLKKTLGISENASGDAEMADISEIATVVDKKTLKERTLEKENESESIEKMDDDTGKASTRKTLIDEHGNYPVWMNRRKIAKIKKGRAKAKKATAKQTKRLTRRDKKKLKQKGKKMETD